MTKRTHNGWMCAIVIAIVPAMRTVAADTGLEYPLYRLPVAPTIDGQVDDDPAWAGVPEATGFFKLGAGYSRAKQTQVRAAWRADTLYLAVHCEEPDIGGITAMLSDGGDLWSEDGVEFFVRPQDTNGFYQFILNTGGARRGASLAEGRLDWQAAATRMQDAYTLEMAIPFALFGVAPVSGQIWRGNFCRNIFTHDSGGDQFTTWAPLVASFHEWDRFARWKFTDDAPDPAKTPAVEVHLNGAYREFLQAELKELDEHGAGYLPILGDAAKVPQFAAAAEELIRNWREASRLTKLGAMAPAIDLRKAVAVGERLEERSRKLKYDYLFWELFNS